MGRTAAQQRRHTHPDSGSSRTTSQTAQAGASNAATEARALGLIGTIRMRRGEPDTAAPILERVLAHFKAHGSRSEQAWALRQRGNVELVRSKFADAETYYRRALDAAKGADASREELSDTWEALGLAKEQVGEPQAAKSAYSAGLRLVRGDLVREAELMYRQSVIDGRAGHILPAVRWARRGLRTLEGIKDRRAVACRAKLYSMLAGVRVRQGQDREAIELARQAIRAAEIAGEQESLANGCLVIAWALSSMGAAEDETYSQRALGIYEGIGDLLGQSMALNNIGMRLYWQERWSDAVDAWVRASETSARAGDAVGAAFGDCNIAEVLSDQGRFEEAEARFRRALQIWRGTGDEQGVAYASAQLGRTYIRAGRIDEGLELLRDALERYRALRVKGDALDAEVWIAEGETARNQPPADEALDELMAEVEDESPTQRTLERVAAFSLAQRGELEAARERLARAADLARKAEGSYELAIILDGLVRLGGADAHDGDMAAERDAIMGNLGIVRLPEPPLEGAPVDGGSGRSRS